MRWVSRSNKSSKYDLPVCERLRSSSNSAEKPAAIALPLAMFTGASSVRVWRMRMQSC